MTSTLRKLTTVALAASSIVVPAQASIRLHEPSRADESVYFGLLDVQRPMNQTFTLAAMTLQAESAPRVPASPVLSTANPVQGVGLLSVIADLQALSDGFLGPGSLAPTHTALANLSLLGEILQPVQIGPTASGGVVLEWNDQAIEYTAEIEADGTLFMCIDDPDSDVAEAETRYSPELLRDFLRAGVLPTNV